VRCTATGDLCRDASSALRLAEFVAVVSSITSTIALTMSSSAHEIMRRLTEPFEG